MSGGGNNMPVFNHIFNHVEDSSDRKVRDALFLKIHKRFKGVASVRPLLCYYGQREVVFCHWNRNTAHCELIAVCPEKPKRVGHERR
jgi:hypothetical protein